MALWQNTFYVLPKQKALEISPALIFAKSEDGFDDSVFWIGGKFKTDFFYPINNFLPQLKSSYKGSIAFGDFTSNCFEIFHENGYVVSVSFRIDYRSHYENILDKILEFLLIHGFIIIDENLEVMPLNLDSIKEKIEGSPQYAKYKKLSHDAPE